MLPVEEEAMANGQRGESKTTMKSERVDVIHAVSSMAPIHQKPIDIFHATSMLKLEGFDLAGTWLGKCRNLRHNLR